MYFFYWRGIIKRVNTVVILKFCKNLYGKTSIPVFPVVYKRSVVCKSFGSLKTSFWTLKYCNQSRQCGILSSSWILVPINVLYLPDKQLKVALWPDSNQVPNPGTRGQVCEWHDPLLPAWVGSSYDAYCWLHTRNDRVHGAIAWCTTPLSVFQDSLRQWVIRGFPFLRWGVHLQCGTALLREDYRPSTKNNEEIFNSVYNILPPIAF